MPALAEIQPWHWAGFISCVLVFLFIDLGVFHRRPHAVTFKEALAWTILWVALSFAFAGLLSRLRGPQESVEFITAYVIELALSFDNVFVIALVFAYFRVPAEYQHRVLFWGILGALLMRGVMIAAGVGLIEHFQWTLYLFGSFLILTGLKMLFVKSDGVHPEKNLVVRCAKKLFPVTAEMHGQRFSIKREGRRFLTPLALVLVVVETTDLVFALDSIPAIFAVTTKPFIVFTSNVFAILGLRSMYFVLVGAIEYFRYLKIGLSIVLIFVGTKMLLTPHGEEPRWFQLEIPTGVSLLVVAGILAAAMFASILVARWEKRSSRT